MPTVTVQYESEGEGEVLERIEKVRRAAERAADALAYLREMLDEYGQEEVPIAVNIDIESDSHVVQQ